MLPGEEEYCKAVGSVGGEERDLLGVLSKAIHHNRHSAYSIIIIAAEMEAPDCQDIYGEIGYRAGLVTRHMQDVRRALEEIHKVAQERGYTEITDIFNRTYHAGHPRETEEVQRSA